MIAGIIRWSVRHRAVVWTLAALVALGGLVAVQHTPVDALPDTSDVTVIVLADAPGQDPRLVDEQVTYPLSTGLLTTPGARTVRGLSFFGLSMVHVIFEDGTDRLDARSRVSETLGAATADLPTGITPRLGPDATGVGWVYQYVVRDLGPETRALRKALDVDGDGSLSDQERPNPQRALLTGQQTTCAVHLFGWCFGEQTTGGRGLAVYTEDRLATWLSEGGIDDAPSRVPTLIQGFDRNADDALSKDELATALAFDGLSLGELRSVQDDVLSPDLTSLPGVAEVAGLGGFDIQLQVEVDPQRLEAFGLGLDAVRRAIRDANDQAGGGTLEVAEREHMIRADATLRTPGDLEAAPVGFDPSTHLPIRLDQVARVQWGPAPRRGLSDLDGTGDVVSGIVVMRPDANARAVSAAVAARIQALRPSLPPGIVLETAYDRGPLVDRAIHTLTTRLAEEISLVVLICGLFLLRFRSALVPALSLPMGVLVTFLGMRALGLRADVMSLGGIAIAVGVMIDASLVLVENVHKRAETHPDEDPVDRVIAACVQVGPAIFQSLLIVTLSFLPVFALEQAEGRLFRPLAWTKTLAMAGASLLAITVVPALLVPVARGRFRDEADHPITSRLIRAYRPLLSAALARPRTVLATAGLLALTSAWPLSNLSSEFMPPLDEGDLLYMPTTPPGLGLSRARALLQQTDRLIASHPQVDRVLGKAGRADTATDPAPLSMFETTIHLTPRDTWPTGKTLQDVISELDDLVDVPGLTNAWTMPIRARLDMLSTGIRTPVGVKLMGDDLDVLATVATDIERELSGMDGVRSVYAERVTGGRYVDVIVDRERASRWGLSVRAVQDVVRSGIGGAVLTTLNDGVHRHDVTLRYPRALRDDPDALTRLPIPTPMGHTVPLGQVAEIRAVSGPPMIKREDARRTAWIHVDLDTNDLGGWVDQARRLVDQRIRRPPGVSIRWSGQFESMERAANRLAWLVPLVLGLVFVLLQLQFGDAQLAAMLLASVLLFAPLGGLWFLALTGWPLSVAVAVGFIALLGLAAETGVVMVVYLEHALEDAISAGPLDETTLVRATLSGAVDRVRPKLLTVSTTLLGLVPVLVGGGTGSRVMQRIAAPMVGGLVSSTVLTLVVVPVAWFLLRRQNLNGAGTAAGER